MKNKLELALELTKIKFKNFTCEDYTYYEKDVIINEFERNLDVIKARKLLGDDK